ncbi:glycosyltransferase family 2 protein [Candidatus Parcubacteria bacterium]|nr:glycosyltransferase family 2 protein [Candidatus Parcubacteria bacterium]
MKNPIEVSLIIVNYNGFEITRDCLESIFSNRGEIEFEVILVDNASTDGSVEKLEKIFAHQQNLRVIKKTENDFLAPAYNRGFQESRGSIIIFMNNDLVVTKNWLPELLKAFGEPQVGIAGVSLLSYDQKDKIDHQGCGLNFLGYATRINAGKVFQPEHSMRKVFFVPGAVLAIRRELFETAGGFDGSYGGYYEDVDLAWQARLLGYKAVVARGAVVYHRRSWTITKYLSNSRAAFLCRRNRLTTILKNAGVMHLALVLPFYLALQLAVFLKELLLDRNPRRALTTPQAIRDNLINFKTIRQKRRETQQSRRVSNWSIERKT